MGDKRRMVAEMGDNAEEVVDEKEHIRIQHRYDKKRITKSLQAQQDASLVGEIRAQAWSEQECRTWCRAYLPTSSCQLSKSVAGSATAHAFCTWWRDRVLYLMNKQQCGEDVTSDSLDEKFPAPPNVANLSSKHITRARVYGPKDGWNPEQEENFDIRGGNPEFEMPSAKHCPAQCCLRSPSAKPANIPAKIPTQTPA